MEYWSFGKRIIYTMFVLSVLIGTFATEGFAEHFADNLPESTRNHRSRITESNPLILVQSATEKSEDSDRATVENENGSAESTSSSKEGSGTTPREAETKQIKPFKPSEEIAAEQAVDFPWDI